MAEYDAARQLELDHSSRQIQRMKTRAPVILAAFFFAACAWNPCPAGANAHTPLVVLWAIHATVHVAYAKPTWRPGKLGETPTRAVVSAPEPPADPCDVVQILSDSENSDDSEELDIPKRKPD